MIYVWFSAFLLHNLARLLPLYPVLVAGAAGLAILSSVRPRYDIDAVVLILATVVISAYILAIDFMREGAWASPGNIVRLLTPLVALVILMLVDLQEDVLRRLALIFLAIVWLAALSIFYQVASGPILWFAESSERAGVQRFASLLGSLTIFGAAAPVALLIAAMYLRRVLWFSIVAIPLLVAGVMSLQKAALAGFVVAIPFLLLLSGKRAVAHVGAIVALVAVAVIALVPAEFREYAMVGWEYFLVGGGGSTDVGIVASAVSRLTEYPLELIGYHGPMAMILGVGLRGGSGVFGFSDDPMAHNGIVDYIAIGGLPYLAYGLLLMGSIVAAAVRIGRWKEMVVDGDRAAVFVWGLLALYVANLPFASGLAFHPAFCWIPPLLISFAAAIGRRVRRSADQMGAA